jgi:hypothetical protein
MVSRVRNLESRAFLIYIKMDIKKFENSLIAFDIESEMVNATDMAKVYGKRPIDFLRLDSTLAFIEALRSDVSQNHIEENQIVTTVKGGKQDKSQGTWMCRKLSYKFAAWLDPKFEVFVYSIFDEVIEKYKKETQEKLINQQRQLDYFWDKSDNNDIYGK